MKIRFNGHSSFSVFSRDGKCIVIDPYQTGSFGGTLNYGRIDSKPDVVLMTHSHPDHAYVGQFAGQFDVLKDAGKSKGFDFKTVDAFHDQNNGADRGKIKIFLFEVDCVNLCHLGDLGHVLSKNQLDQIGPVDVLMIPVGGYYTIDAAQASEIVGAINPKIAIPMHYKTEKCDFPITPVDHFTKGKNNVKHVDADEIELFAEKLPAVPEIIVMKYHC
jgi:L-ascorbate metabolism protein UlaG (beta-lactamase superfamily)